MSRIDELNARYQRSSRLIAQGVELVAVGDPRSARVNAAIREVMSLARNESSYLWEDLLGAAKALRWCLLTQPQPLEFNTSLQRRASDVVKEATRLQMVVAPKTEQVLKELAAASDAVLSGDQAVAHILLESIRDVGIESCVVIGANSAAVGGLESWLNPLGVAVRNAGQLVRDQVVIEQGYAVGPPRFFPSSLVTAPMTEALSYLLPAWFGDRSVPSSVLAPYAEGAVRVNARTFTEGDTSEPMMASTENAVEEVDLVPQPVWTAPPNSGRLPRADEVSAHRVLLSGGYAILLDDGDRIRAVDPTQPAGERVAYIDVEAVSRGTYLLLRDGETERRALYDAALELMGAHAHAAAESQARWKGELQSRLNKQGQTVVTAQLAKLGISALDRIEAWTDLTLVRPKSDRDFELLLEWLDIPLHPGFELATDLARKRARASRNITSQLEHAVDAADTSILEREGHIHLEVTDGFRGVFATRVLAVSPHIEFIPRHDARVLIKDRGAKWLE
ncbi:hypothetical protein ACFYSW_28765 [Rhodococcus aetherivorans]|uniref:hypothetical protein n=1 Tax=Rhodococcus aetherivorans TaxID=191292 RepID=UPI0036790E96